jgi:hypothetical protein
LTVSLKKKSDKNGCDNIRPLTLTTLFIFATRLPFLRCKIKRLGSFRMPILAKLMLNVRIFSKDFLFVYFVTGFLGFPLSLSDL